MTPRNCNCISRKVCKKIRRRNCKCNVKQKVNITQKINVKVVGTRTSTTI
jgi:hypothetical protein